MKLSDFLATFLVKENVRHIFQVIGGASVHMVNSIAENKHIDYICVQHEQAGAMAAEAYSRITNNLGAAMATSGPGMTNLITGIACAYFDSIPVIYITGQVNTFESKQWRKVRQVGFQETDIVDMVKVVTKYAVQIIDPKKIRYELEKAVYFARSGRPGPVLVDIPLDVQRAQVDPNTLEKFIAPKVTLDRDDKSRLHIKIKEATTLLYQANRPVIIAGGAIRYANQTDAFLKLVNTFKIPVVATWSGIDVLSHDHPLYCGQIGVYGNRAANFTIQNCDVLLSIGSRLDTRITGGKAETFARAAKKIIVDIDSAELFKKRGLDPDIGICADVRDVIPFFLKTIKRPVQDISPWLKRIQEWKERYPNVLPQWRTKKNNVDPYVFIETLSKIMPNNAIVITDCGANLTWTIQAVHVKKGQRVISAMGNSPMGYSFPASIGASFAMDKKPIICIIGDGGLQMNLQELQTLVHYRVPVKVFILNNHSYGIIKQFQDTYFNGRYEATTPISGYSMPDFCKVAKAYGLPSLTIKNHKELRDKINKVLIHKGPIICDVIVPNDAKIIPKLSFGNPIEELSPDLPQTEFLKQMIIPPLEKDALT